MAAMQIQHMRVSCPASPSCLHGEFSGPGGCERGLVGSGRSSVAFRVAVVPLASPLAVVSREGKKRVSRRGVRPGVQVPRREAVIADLKSELGGAVLEAEKASNDGGLPTSNNNGMVQQQMAAVEESTPEAMEIDAVTEAELKENGFRSTRRTKLICTIGPATCSPEQLEALAMGGMNVARLNMCHGTRDWHTQVIRNVRSLNSEKGYSVAIMMDTEGSEIHMGDLGGAPSAKAEVRHSFKFCWLCNVPSHPRLECTSWAGQVDVGCQVSLYVGDWNFLESGYTRNYELINVTKQAHCRYKKAV